MNTVVRASLIAQRMMSTSIRLSVARDYAELKHDTVLYGKQPVAQAGGMIEYAKVHYVEPNIPLYGKLLYLTDALLSILEALEMDNDYLFDGANRYKALLELLIDCYGSVAR